MNKNFDLIIDVRSLDEYKEEHLEGSMNIPVDIIASNFNSTILANLDKNTSILLICRSGGRAGIVKEILESKGFIHVEYGGSYKNRI